MAGGKETPRQKMIGMMYLVLTALLALQVSNSVLEKFIFINATLEELVKENDEVNGATLSSIEAAFNEKGKRPEHKRVFDAAEKLRASTAALITDMDTLKAKMVKITGGYEEGSNTKILGAKDDEKVSAMMTFSPDGKQLETDLDNYVAMLNDLIKEHELAGFPEGLSQLTKDASEIEVFKDDPDQKNKDFLTVTFLKTPTAAGLSSMSQLETEVLEYEGQVLKAMASKVDAAIVDFNIIVPMVRPRSEVVAAGSTYEADLFITASADGIDPVMKINGKEIKVAPDKHGILMGKVEIPTRNAGTQKFLAEITMNDTTFKEEMTYEVIQPSIDVSSATLNALYANCANPLNIRVPLLGTDYNPKFGVTNGKQLPGQNGFVEIIPTSRRAVDISVSSNGNYIGKKTFQVKNIPEPKITVLDRTNVRADNKESISRSNASRLTVQVLPDANFAQEAPKDKVYIVQKGRIFIPGQAPKSFTGPIINVGNARPGTYSISIDQVSRRKYDGTFEAVRLDSKFRSVTVK